MRHARRTKIIGALALEMMWLNTRTVYKKELRMVYPWDLRLNRALLAKRVPPESSSSAFNSFEPPRVECDVETSSDLGDLNNLPTRGFVDSIRNLNPA